MNKERYERTITIGGVEYPACYTIAAYLYNLRAEEKEGSIASLDAAGKYERLINMGVKLINGAIARRNMETHGNEPLITADHVLLYASTDELDALVEAVGDIMAAGNQRAVKTEDEEFPTKKEGAE